MSKVKGSDSVAFRALVKALPVVIGYFPIGFAFGVMASQAGLSIMETAAMSTLVYAGAAQMAAAGMIGSGAGIASIALATFFINLRHLLMGSALSPFLGHLNKKLLAWFSFQLTDETFALHSQFFNKEGSPGKTELLTMNLWPHLSWIGSSALGVWGAGMVVDVDKWGLDYALPAMFIALLLMQVQSFFHVIVAVAAAGLSTLIYFHWGAGWNVIIAAVIGATLGVGCEYWKKKPWLSS